LEGEPVGENDKAFNNRMSIADKKLEPSFLPRRAPRILQNTLPLALYPES